MVNAVYFVYHIMDGMPFQSYFAPRSAVLCRFSVDLADQWRHSKTVPGKSRVPFPVWIFSAPQRRIFFFT